MKTTLTRPCKDCPFIEGGTMNRSLDPERMPSIIKALREDKSFVCHKTMDLEWENQQHCAGAMIFLEREKNPNQWMRISERLGGYDHTKLDMTANIVKG